jgi:endonuclease/exonuclease/phosphatase family metal-dependent hydrolase
MRAGEGGPLLQFTSTHLDQGRDSEDRLAQARSLQELPFIEGRPTILAGDLNARLDTDIMKMFEAHWIVTPSADASPAAPDGRPRLRSDYVLFRPLDGWRVSESRVIDETSLPITGSGRARMGRTALTPY